MLLRHRFPLHCSKGRHDSHLAPLEPQAVSTVPGSHTPAALQQPRGQLTVEQGFDDVVPQAMTPDAASNSSRRLVMTRLSGRR